LSQDALVVSDGRASAAAIASRDLHEIGVFGIIPTLGARCPESIVRRGFAIIKVFIYAVSNLLSAVASLLSILVLSRLLSAEAFGRYATVLALAAVCQTVGFNWLQSSILRLHPEEADENGRALFARAVRFGFVLSAIVVFAVWTIGLAAIGQLSADTRLLSIAGLSILLTGAWAAVGLSWNRVTAHPWRFAMAQVLQTLGGLALALIGLVWRPGDPFVAVMALAVASLLASAVARLPIAGVSKGFRQLRPRLHQIWTYGAPATAVALGYVVLAASDRLLIASSLGPAAAGAYAAASGMAGRALSLLLPPIVFATRPQVFIEFSQRGSEPAQQLLRRVSGWLFAVGLPVTLLFVCVPRPLSSLIIGGELAVTAAEVLPWMAVGSLLSAFLTLHFATAFQIARRNEWMLLAVAPAAAFNVLSTWLLLPRFGILAAGWSMVASYAIALALAIRFGSRHFRVPFSVSDAMRTTAACAPLVAFLQLEFQPTTSGFILMLGGGALVYVASALALNVVHSRSYLMRWLGT
jgi:O-antigen/teichoic acid export membrane protein